MSDTIDKRDTVWSAVIAIAVCAMLVFWVRSCNEEKMHRTTLNLELEKFKYEHQIRSSTAD